VEAAARSADRDGIKGPG